VDLHHLTKERLEARATSYELLREGAAILRRAVSKLPTSEEVKVEFECIRVFLAPF